MCAEPLDAQRFMRPFRKQNLVPVNAHVGDQANLAGSGRQHPCEIDDERLRPPDRNADVIGNRAPLAAGGPGLKDRRLQRQSGLVRGDVVARERVVGPAGQQHQIGAHDAERHGQRVPRGVAANGAQREIVRIAAVDIGNAGRHVVTVVIGHARRRMGGAGLKQPERFGWIRHSFVREHVHIGRVRNREQRQSIDEHRFFELVRHANFIAAVLRPQLALAYADVLDGIRPVADTRGFPIAHFPATHEIGHELETAAVPRVQERTRRRFTIELLDRHGRGQRRAAGRGRFRLKDSGRPQHANDIGAGPRAEAEHDIGRRGERR